MGVLVIAVNIGCVLLVKYERPSGSKDYYKRESILIVSMVIITQNALVLVSLCLALCSYLVHSCCDITSSCYCSRCSDP